jgi:hypothetical protein
MEGNGECLRNQIIRLGALHICVPGLWPSTKKSTGNQLVITGAFLCYPTRCGRKEDLFSVNGTGEELIREQQRPSDSWLRVGMVSPLAYSRYPRSRFEKASTGLHSS